MASLQQFQGALVSGFLTLHEIDGLSMVILIYSMYSLLTMMYLSAAMWNISLTSLPFNLSALQARLIMRGSTLKGQISMSSQFSMRNKKLSMQSSSNFSWAGCRQYSVGTETNTLKMLMKSSLLMQRTRLQVYVAMSMLISAILLPQTSLKLMKTELEYTLNWKLPPNESKPMVLLGIGLPSCMMEQMKTPLQKSRMQRVLPMMAISCGNKTTSLNLVIYLYLYLMVSSCDGYWMMNTCLLDLFSPISSPDQPCSTLSIPPNMALLNSDNEGSGRTLLRMVLVLTSHTPSAVNRYRLSSLELATIVGGEMLSSPICSSRLMNLSSLQEMILSMVWSLQWQAVSSDWPALRMQSRDLEQSSTQLFYCQRVF